MLKPLTIGTRKSQLALWQTNHVRKELLAAWPELAFAVRTFTTTGDQVLDRPLPAIGGKGLFTEALESALRSGEIDIAVHSLKDLPVADPPGLTVGAVLSRADVRDILISRAGFDLQTLPPGAVVGTSSLRRQAQLLAARPDLEVRSIRGNVETRIRKVMEGQYDAAVLASAGVQRLGLNDHEGRLLSLNEMLPAPGQGALAVQCRAADEDSLALLAAINDEAVRSAVTAERSFLYALGGGCAVPVAAYAQATDEGWQLQGLVADPAGRPLVRVSDCGRDPLALGQELAGQAALAGANAILDRLKPLRGRRIVITRSAEQAGPFAERLALLGAEPVLFPVIDFAPSDPQLLQAYLAQLDAYSWIVFTSANAVRFFFEIYDALEDAPPLPKIAAVGQITGDLLQVRSLSPDFVPDVYTGEALAAGLGDLSGQRVLLPRARAGRPQIVEGLRENGALVDDVPLYETVTAVPSARALAEIKHGVDTVTFTSPSSVRNFRTLLTNTGIDADALLAEALTVCIGPSTAAQIEEFGLTADLVPAVYTVDGMIEAMLVNN
ncbi:MAG: hydroxymethylbilane synthase [Candidatus Promineifilaceae bacterium]|jgi:hydroxymethylbilane synthase